MAATPKPLRTRMKKMAAESRESGKEQHKGVKKSLKETAVKQTKEKGSRKRVVNFVKSQY